jgi:tRNA A-37 threonylcarbamoyl transferase component Bud32
MRQFVQDGWRWECAEGMEHLLPHLMSEAGMVVKRKREREVARVETEGRAYYRKRYFHGCSLWRQLKVTVRAPRSRSSWETAKKLMERSVGIVPHLAYGERGTHESVLITEELPGFCRPGDEEMRELGHWMRQLHDAGVWWQDAHLGNVLVNPTTREFRLLDLDNVELRPALDERSRVEGLARLHRRTELTAEFFAGYGMRLPGVEQRAEAIRRHSAAKRARRCLAASERYRAGISWFVQPGQNNSVTRAIMDDPDGFLAERCRVLKPGRSSTVGAADGYVLKRYNFRWRWGVLLDLVRRSRGLRAYRKAVHLTELGLATPKPVAAAEVRWAGWLKKSYFLMDEVAAAVGLGEMKGDRRRAARALGELIGQLHEAGFSHRDLKETNVLFHGGWRPVLIDLEGVQYWGKVPAWRARKDLKRLERGVAAKMTGFGRAERFAFWRGYRAARPGGLGQ